MKQTHGGDIYTAKEQYTGELFDFSANINPLGLQQCVRDAICANLDVCENYPDPQNRALRAAISNYEGVNERQIICGNGSADLIFKLALAFKPKRALLPAPTFAEYEYALRSVGTEIVYHDLHEENAFAVSEDILHDLTTDIDMLFLCNPNNPTGQIISRALMADIINRCRECGILLVVDECFLDFTEQELKDTVKPYLNLYPNLFILKAFTKIFAMPGIRLGYGMCANETLLESLNACGQPWSVSAIAAIAGVTALTDTDYVARSKQLIAQERNYLTEALNKLGMKTYDSKSNYIFFRAPNALDLKESLFRRGILIRSCDNYRGLDNSYWRIAVKDHRSNEMLIASLNEILL